jgi:hypothetical protein
MSANGVDPVDLAVEFTRTVPASGNLGVGGQQFWLGPAHAGATIGLWADTTVVHVLKDGARVKTVPSRLTVAQLRQLLADLARPAGRAVARRAAGQQPRHPRRGRATHPGRRPPGGPHPDRRSR